MEQPMRLLSVIFLAIACSRGPDIKENVGVAPPDTGSDYDCSGVDDDCIAQACEACVDACGSSCGVMDIYPMEYSCSEGYWTVYDFCPEWSYEDSGLD